MVNRIKTSLPNAQHITLENKVLWESARIMAVEKELTITKFVEYAVEFLMKHDKRDLFIEAKKMGIL